MKLKDIKLFILALLIFSALFLIAGVSMLFSSDCWIRIMALFPFCGLGSTLSVVGFINGKFGDDL